MNWKAPEARSVLAQGLSLRLWDHGGPPQAPTVLCVHGYLDTGRSFDACARELGGEARCLAIDLRGHGQSDRVGAGGSYHLLDHLKDLAIVLHTLAQAGSPVDVLVAHSMGGNIAFLLAGAKPASVRRLVLLDSLGPPPETDEAPQRLAELLDSVLREKRPFAPAAGMNDAVERLQAFNAGLSDTGARRMLEPVLVPLEDGTLGFPFDARLRGPSPVRWTQGTWLALAARMTMPVKVLCAEKGYVTSTDFSGARLAAMPRAQMRFIPGGHHLHVDAPGEVAATVREILRES